MSIYTTLAEVLIKEKQNTNLVNATKISLSYKNIVCIGSGVPNVFLNITKLYLSDNKILSLDGVEIFKFLTHFSISYNKLEKIEELDKIWNKTLIVSLSVKGNMFCKNPMSSIKLIHKFPNLRDLDGFKISDATFKLMEDLKEIREDIIPFLFILENKILEIQKISNLIKLNQEYESKYCKFNTESYNQNDLKVLKIQNLLRIAKVFTGQEENLKKYLKKNINPSIYVIKKIIQTFVPNENFLVENFRPPDRNSVSQIYEKLFNNILTNYKEKKNDNELPFYLNYLVLKSNPKLEKFFTQKVIERENFSIDGEKNSYEIIKFICRNFEKLFERYTNYGKETLNKLQLIQFYYLHPPQAKIISKYLPIFENLENQQMQIRKENKHFTGEEINSNQPPEKKSYTNPFMTRLNQACDIYPIKEHKIEFVTTKYDYEYSSSFQNIELESFWENSLEKINLDKFYKNLTNFLNNYSITEFPLFCLNFDYMRTITNVIQDKISEYIAEYDSIEKVLKMLRENRKNALSSASSERKENFPIPKIKKDSSKSPRKQFNAKQLYEEYKKLHAQNSFSQRSYTSSLDAKRGNESEYHSEERINRFFKESDTKSIFQNLSRAISKSISKSRSVSKSPSVDKDVIKKKMKSNKNNSKIANNLVKIVKVKCCGQAMDNLNNIGVGSEKISNVILIELKRVFFNNLKYFCLHSKLDELFFTIDKSLFVLKKRLKIIYFDNIKRESKILKFVEMKKLKNRNNSMRKFFDSLKINFNTTKQCLLRIKRNKIKKFLTIIINMIKERKFTKHKSHRSKLFYYKTLLRKGFKSLKFNSYTKKLKIKNPRQEYSKEIFNFFHSQSHKKEPANYSEYSLNNFKESDYSSNINKDYFDKTNKLEYKHLNQEHLNVLNSNRYSLEYDYDQDTFYKKSQNDNTKIFNMNNKQEVKEISQNDYDYDYAINYETNKHEDEVNKLLDTLKTRLEMTSYNNLNTKQKKDFSDYQFNFTGKNMKKNFNEKKNFSFAFPKFNEFNSMITFEAEDSKNSNSSTKDLCKKINIKKLCYSCKLNKKQRCSHYFKDKYYHIQLIGTPHFTKNTYSSYNK